MMRQQVKVVNDVPLTDLCGRQLGPLEPGEEIEAWVWEAKVLERHGLAERRKISSTEIRQLIISEERSPDIEKLPENFYFSVREEISKHHASGHHEEADELKSQILALIEIRLPKLLNLVLSPEDSHETLDEEKFLINRLASLLTDWNRKLERFLEAGEEVNRGDFRGNI